MTFRRYGVAAFALMTALACYAEEQAGACQWYRADALARELSQLDQAEVAKFADTDLLDVRPVVLPHPGYVVGPNDYFMWPIATKVDDTLVVLYARSTRHWGGGKEKGDGNGGIRMVTTSSDGGATWTTPVDVVQAGRWESSPFKGFGAGLGAHEGIVYLALNQGVYRSEDKGRSWRLASDSPVFEGVPERLWGPGMRITFDDAHGLVIWTTTGFADVRKTTEDYGDRMCAAYSPDFGGTWHYEDQALPEGIGLSEVTPVQFDGQMAFLLRNGIHDVCYAQGYSATGWFPFQFAVTDIGPVVTVDTPDIAYNPVTKRLEAAVSHRRGSGPGPSGGMKVNLYSITPSELAAGNTKWRYDGTLVRYKGLFGKSDGFNPVGSVIDEAAGLQYVYVWGGDGTGTAGIFQYTRSLDTPAVSDYLKAFDATGLLPPQSKR